VALILYGLVALSPVHAVIGLAGAVLARNAQASVHFLLWGAVACLALVASGA